MKLPHITVEYRDEESFAPGKLSAYLIIGFGVFLGWDFLMIGASELLFPLRPDASSAGRISFIGAMSLTLLMYASFSQQARILFETAEKRSRNRRIGTAFTLAGMLVLLASCLNASLSVVIATVAGILTGFGGAILMMSFAISFSICDTATVALSVALSLPIACLTYAGALSSKTLSDIVALVIFYAVPIIVIWCLQKSSAQIVDGLSFASSTLPTKKGLLAFYIGVCTLLFGLLMGIAAQFAFPFGTPFYTSEYYLAGASILASVVCSILLIVAMLVQRQTVGYSLRTMSPIIGLALTALMLISVQASQFTTLFFSFVAYLLIEASIWIFLSDLSQRYRISGFQLFGFGRAFMGFAWLIIYFASIDETFIDRIFVTSEPLVALALLFLIIAIATMPRDSEMRRTLKKGSQCLAFYQTPTFDQEQILAQKAQQTKQEPVNQQTIQSDSPASSAAAQTDSTIVAPQTEPIPLEKVQETNPISDAEKGLGGTQIASEEPPSTGSEIVGKFRRKCSVIADTYLLSRRETEVLFLLAKGFSSSMIQEKLYISEGTANTHMRHVYRKINVHSQQELIRLVESVNLEE